MNNNQLRDFAVSILNILAENELLKHRNQLLEEENKRYADNIRESNERHTALVGELLTGLIDTKSDKEV